MFSYPESLSCWQFLTSPHCWNSRHFPNGLLWQCRYELYSQSTLSYCFTVGQRERERENTTTLHRKSCRFRSNLTDLNSTHRQYNTQKSSQNVNIYIQVLYRFIEAVNVGKRSQCTINTNEVLLWKQTRDMAAADTNSYSLRKLQIVKNRKVSALTGGQRCYWWSEAPNRSVTQLPAASRIAIPEQCPPAMILPGRAMQGCESAFLSMLFNALTQ